MKWVSRFLLAETWNRTHIIQNKLLPVGSWADPEPNTCEVSDSLQVTETLTARLKTD